MGDRAAAEVQKIWAKLVIDQKSPRQVKNSESGKNLAGGRGCARAVTRFNVLTGCVGRGEGKGEFSGDNLKRN
jgi:hypothetical protein